MAIDFDFIAPEVQASANGVAAQANVTVCTIPLSSAAFPMQSGRVVSVEADFVCTDSDGNAFGGAVKRVFSTTSTHNFSNGYVQSAFQIAYNGTTSVGGSSGGSVSLSSGDLIVTWNNDYPGRSTVTQDVSVRVRMRWVGA